MPNELESVRRLLEAVADGTGLSQPPILRTSAVLAIQYLEKAQAAVREAHLLGQENLELRRRIERLRRHLGETYE